MSDSNTQHLTIDGAGTSPRSYNADGGQPKQPLSSELAGDRGAFRVNSEGQVTEMGVERMTHRPDYGNTSDIMSTGTSVPEAHVPPR